MKQWLLNKWQTKSDYILSLVLMITLMIIKFVLSGNPVTREGVGIATGAFIGFVVWFGSIIFVDIKNIKVRKPKAVFVEPSQLKIRCYWFGGMAVVAILGIMILTIIDAVLTRAGIENAIYGEEGNTVGILGNAIMMFFVTSIVIAPIAVYTLNAKLRYKRIVEYKTAEWTRLQK